MTDEFFDDLDLDAVAADDAALDLIGAGQPAVFADPVLDSFVTFRAGLDLVATTNSATVIPIARRRLRRIGVAGAVTFVALSATGVAAALSGANTPVLGPLHRNLFSGNHDRPAVTPSTPSTSAKPADLPGATRTPGVDDTGGATGGPNDDPSESQHPGNESSGPDDGHQGSGGGPNESDSPEPRDTETHGGGDGGGDHATPEPTETESPHHGGGGDEIDPTEPVSPDDHSGKDGGHETDPPSSDG